MKVRSRNKILFTVFYPCFPLCVLALGTVPVTAGVIAYAYMPACIALIHMTTQRCCTTTLQCTQGASQVCVGGMFLLKLHSEPANDLSQFEGWFQLSVYNLSNGLNRFVLLGFATCKYTMVVSIRSCPSSSLMETISIPYSSK